ncbi:MAG: DUF2267 domain-containing protein [Candidatus Rokubacteria bacterium]|nr:DUF2267 domain-containing protein [Candidatus Rokubacteria bacterium]
MRPEVFYRRVVVETGRDVGDGRRATAAVLCALRDRLTPEEAEQAAAQLPAELKAVWRTGERRDRRPAKMRRDAFLERVRTEAQLETPRQARAATVAVFAALKDQLSTGEADDILAQLPKDLKDVWRAA